MTRGAGDLDRRVTLERYGVTRDAWNNPIEGWLPLATVWASKHDISDTERLRGAEVGSTLTTRFVIRWSKTVTDFNTKDRLVCEGLERNPISLHHILRRRSSLRILWG